ncbi:AAA family ATPase [Roseovarius sp.]|uniref:AAA family ATPase n=1 Tax=Roseovarius sp. TaxID=1486281 RepID=UPI0026347007|nr:AAA family ATPase [Roseovarius sp.]MDM8167650.1 AAA family ATPase [Roseovarius sp.]
MEFRLECLGGFAMTRDGDRVALSARKPRLLAGLLAVARRRTMSRQRLAALLWEHSDSDQARASLRQALLQIRRAGGDGWVEAEGDDLRLGAGVVTDLDVFHDALARNDPTEAVRLYGGPFLDGLDVGAFELGQVVAEHRARLAGLVTDALSRELERMGDSPDAAALAHRLLAHDPLNEAAHRRLMTLDAARGMRGAVRSRYNELEAALRRDLGTAPDPETRALYDRLRRGAGTAPRPPAPDTGANSDAPTPETAFLLLCMEADGTPDFASLRETASAHGAVELEARPGEVAFVFTGQPLHDVSNTALQLAADAGPTLSFGLAAAETAEHATSRAIVQVRRLAAMAEPGDVLVIAELAPRLGLTVESSQRAVSLQLGAMRKRPDLPIIGRDTELAQITAAITAAQTAGSGLTIHLAGEAGIGKSRLAAEIARSVGESGMRIARAGFEAFSPGSRHLAQRIMAALPALPRPEEASSIDRAVWSWLRDEHIGNEVELRMSALSPEAQQERIVDVLAAALTRAAQPSGLLVVIEDCHWRPVGAGDFILDLVKELQNSRAVVLLTERPGSRSLDRRLAVRALPGLVRVTLPPLPEARARDLVRALAPGNTAPEAAIERAAGHPLFLIRLLEANWTDGALPTSVAELVQEQVERLPEAERGALRQAAVLGAGFDPAEAAAIFPATARLRPSGDLLHETETGLAFGHDLVHLAIYEAIPEETRQDWHARAAAFFRGGDPLRWADHALRAPDDADAGHATVAAANAMVAARRFSAAFPYIDKGLARDADPESHAELYSCRASIRRTRGDMAGALEDYRTAHALATRAETRVAMLTRQALVLHRLGQGDAADRALDAAEDIADSIGLAGPGRAEIHEQRGNRAFVRGDHAACMAHHAAALDAAELAGDPRGIARGHGGIGDAAYAAGRFTTAYGHFTKAIETAEQAGLGLVREEYMFMRAFSLFFADPGPQAFLLADVAVDSAVQCGAARTELIAREIRAEMRTANGDLAGLEEDLVAISKLATARGETRFMKDVQTLYAYLHMRRGDLQTARDYIRPFLDDAGSDAYIGGKILGLAALLAEDRAARDDWIAKGRECIARGSLAHSVFWYHASVLERAVMDDDRALAREVIDAMLAFAAEEPIGIVSLYIRTAELLLWPSSEADRRSHADVVRSACLEDCAQILLSPEQDYARP